MEGDNNGFGNDIASRYADRLEPAQAPKVGWRDREMQITKEISSSPDESVSSFIWNFDKLYANNLKSLIRGRKFAEARSYYDGIRKTIEDNRDQIGILTQIGDIGGPNSRELAKRAQDIFQYKFDDWEVDMTDGSKATVGQVLSDDSPYLADRARDLNGHGFSGLSSDMYLNGSDTQKAVLGSIIDPFVQQVQSGKNLQGAGVVPNHRQMTDLANDISKNWDVLSGVFGEDGIGEIVDFVKETHAKSGNAVATLRSLAEFANNYQDGSMSGAELARKARSGYEGLLNFAMGGDAVKNGKPVELTDNARRNFDAFMIPAVAELSKRVGKFDFDDPKLRRAVAEVADTMAYASAAGIDMIRDSRNSRNNINSDFGKYIADAVTGLNPPSDNIVSSMRSLRSSLDGLVTGGRDAATVQVQTTGQSRDYITSVDKANGTKSLCPAADAMALDIKQYVTRSIAPYMAGGYRADDALSYIRDDEGRRSEFMSGLTGLMMNYFHGEGRDEIAKIMSQAAVDCISQNRPFCLQDVVESMLNDGEFDPNLQSYKTLATWYHGNITSAASYAPALAEIENHWKTQGFSDAQVRREVGKAAQRMSSAASRGLSPQAIVDEATGVGMAMVPVKDKDGNLTDVARMPVSLNNVGFSFTDRRGVTHDVPRGTYRGERQAWDVIQNILSEEKKLIDATRTKDENQARADASYIRRAEERERIKAKNQEQF